MKIRIGSTFKYLLWYILGSFVVFGICMAFPSLITAAGVLMG